MTPPASDQGDGVLVLSGSLPAQEPRAAMTMDDDGVEVVAERNNTPPKGPAPVSGSRSLDSEGRSGSAEGRVYTWQDGDSTRRVRVLADLTLNRDGEVVARQDVAKDTADGGRDTDGSPPVFRAESSGTLLTLPGGVLLVLAGEWTGNQVDSFFSRQRHCPESRLRARVPPERILRRDRAGLPLARPGERLAVQEGVELSSPNWMREVAPQ